MANCSKLYKTDGDAVTLFDNFKSLEQSKPGMPDNVVTAGIPTEDEFKTLHTKLIDVTTDPPVCVCVCVCVCDEELGSWP